MIEFIYFFTLQLTILTILITAHQLRAKFTMGPLFALVGVFVILLWQILQLGWWISHNGLIVDASRLTLLPNLLSGAIMVYVLDGLRAARAYWFTLLSTGILAIAFAIFQYWLSKEVPIPELFYLSPYTHITILIGLLFSVLFAYLLFAVLKKSGLFLASVVSIAVSVQISLLASSILEYGFYIGLTNYSQQTFVYFLFSLLPVFSTALYIKVIYQMSHFLPVHSIKDLLSFWRSTRDNLEESTDDLLNANKVISDLQRLNQALQESNRINEYQVDRSPLAIIYTNLDGQITFFNPSAQKLLQLSENDKKNNQTRNIIEFIGEFRWFGQLCKHMFKAPKGQRITLQQNGAQSRQCEIILTHRLDASRQHVGYHIVLNDVTAQEQLRQHEQIGARVKGIQSAGRVIIHDFSNLLLGLQGTVAQLKDNFSEQKNICQSSCLNNGEIYTDILQKGIKRGKEMLQQLSLGHTFSSPHLQHLAINQLIDEAVQLSSNQAQNKQVALDKELSDQLWVNVDSTQIVRVLNNLITNAIRATSKRGSIHIRLSKENNGARVEISDTGPGISEENLQAAFDPGFTSKKNGKGGLGLAISYLNIEAHGGELTLEHNQPHGLKAKIWLPLSQLQKESPLFKDKKMILFIKNKPLNDQFYQLYSQENEVVEALHTEEVNALLEEEHWDAIITDQEIKVPRDIEIINLDS